MKKDIPPKYTKKDFEKVYENPLDWCPIFGYIPEINNTYIADIDHGSVLPYEIGKLCIKTIIESRQFLLSYLNINEVDYYTEKYVALPNVKSSIWPGNTRKSIRHLFQHLDHIALLVSKDQNVVELRTYGAVKEGMKPIGRITNLVEKATFISVISGEINLITEDYDVHEIILIEAQKITGNDVKLNLCTVFALFAILEAWITITHLLLYPAKDEHIRRIFKLHQRAQYGNDLLNKAFYYAQEEMCNLFSTQWRDLYKKNMENNKKKVVSARHASAQRQTTTGALKAAIEKLKKQHPVYNERQLYEHIFKNYCVDDNLIKRLCGNDEKVLDKFYHMEDGYDEYHVYLKSGDMTDIDNPFAARLGIIKNRELPRKKPIAFSTYHSEYFYKKK